MSHCVPHADTPLLAAGLFIPMAETQKTRSKAGFPVKSEKKIKTFLITFRLDSPPLAPSLREGEADENYDHFIGRKLYHAGSPPALRRFAAPLAGMTILRQS